MESPYAELTTYYNEVMNGGHYQYFDNVSNTGDLKKEMSTLKSILPSYMNDNLIKAYKAYLKSEERINTAEDIPKDAIFPEDEIIEQCDNEFYDYEDEITELLNKYASEIEL